MAKNSEASEGCVFARFSMKLGNQLGFNARSPEAPKNALAEAGAGGLIAHCHMSSHPDCRREQLRSLT